MPKKTRRPSAPSEFESTVVAACLAGKLVRGGYGAEPSAEAIAADVRAWRAHAQAAGATLRTVGTAKRRARN
jgi:hypothetical protein